MSAYLALFGARFRMLLQYRAAAIAGAGTQLFWGLLRVMIFTAFYESTSAPQPIALPDMITYLWLIQAMFALAMWNVDTDVRAMIRNGTVAYEMLRPLDVYGLWYSRALAARIAPTLLRALPIFALAVPFFGMRLPPSPASCFAWLLAMLGALLLTSAFSTLITISLLYTVSGEGITRITPTLMYALSGMLLPLPLMPSWAQPIIGFLPFRSIVDTPFRLYTGNLPPAALPLALLHQLAWTLTLVVSGRFLLRRALRHLVVQGG